MTGAISIADPHINSMSYSWAASSYGNSKKSGRITAPPLTET